MVSYLKYIVAELRTIQNPESEEGVDARIAAVETLARFISHRRSIGPILDDKTWVSWVLGVDEIDRALLLDEEDHAPVFFSWAEYTDAFPRVPAFAITFRVVEDEEYRNMSHVERSTLTYFDYAGRGVTDSDYDEESSVPYEMVQNSLVFPGNPRYPEKPTMRLSYCAEEVVLDVGTLDLRESDNMVRRGREAIMIFPLDTRHLRTQTPGIALQ